MKRIILLGFFLLPASGIVLGQTIYTLDSTKCKVDGDCNWNDASSWFKNGVAAASAPDGNEPSNGDIIRIPTLSYIGIQGQPNTTEINNSVVLKVWGSIDISGSNARLKLLNGNSTIQLGEGAHLDGGGDNSARLKIGDTEIKGPIIDNLAYPNQLTEDNLDAGGCAQTGDCDDDPLPIVLGSFDISVQDNDVVLEWETISEENFDFFSIERSEDGKNFYEIGTVPGHGNSTERIQYSYVDDNPLFGTSFYRLNAIDYDGSYEKFQSLSVEYVPNELNASIYPNPGNGKHINVLLGLPIEAKLKTISIYNFSGDLILTEELSVGSNHFNLERQLPKGLYFTKILIDNYFISKKLVVN
ncbi:T9SS type A sorting domain-containing protein [Reichenbachiella sp. MALMAid0571]|uniref:T9SS type A sorting domain-containing protein n=1 Tax=Reichenbachiella sp. MALMAid0571 TaxID=3143939 RepID=UPI0032DFF40F